MTDVAPTKTNLLRLRGQLEFARQGHSLLDQKRDILVVELLRLVDQAVEAQEQVTTGLAAAHEALQESVLRMGKLRVTHVSGAVNIAAGIEIGQRRIMGVPLPVVETSFEDHSPYFSPMHTSSWIDAAIDRFKKALLQVGRLAELKISIIRLANEVRKTIRKVNALEKIAIPDLEETVTHIQNRLEESERDMYILMKLVKSRLEAAKAGGSHGRTNL